MSPDDPRHGQPSGYDAHRRDDETACTPCRVAAAKYEYDRRIGRILGRTRTVPGLGSARRIQALVALGWCYSDLAVELGWAHDGPRKITRQAGCVIRRSTADRVAAVYDRLSMTQPPSTTGAERRRVAIAKGTAARYDWAPPLAWDDIDSDLKPLGQRHDYAADYDGNWIVDENTVLRILAGEVLRTNRAEKEEVMRRWLAQGLSQRSLCLRMGWQESRYVSREGDAA